MMDLNKLNNTTEYKHKIGHIVYTHSNDEKRLCIVKEKLPPISSIPYYKLCIIESHEEIIASEYDLTPYSSETKQELKELAKKSLMNLYNENKEVFDKSLTINTLDKELNHSIEELAELSEELAEALKATSKMIKDINHYRRDRIPYENIIEEIYDLHIILTELMLLFDNGSLNHKFKSKMNKYNESIEKQFKTNKLEINEIKIGDKVQFLNKTSRISKMQENAMKIVEMDEVLDFIVEDILSPKLDFFCGEKTLSLPILVKGLKGNNYVFDLRDLRLIDK